MRKDNCPLCGNLKQKPAKMCIACALARRKPWNKGKKGLSEQARKNLSLAHKGKPWSKARRAALSESHRNAKYKSRGKEYAEGWFELRKVIYARDVWKCRECRIKCSTNGKTKIQCHHIDYDVKNNMPGNLITLCSSCHAKTNFRREDWIKHYQCKMKGNT